MYDLYRPEPTADDYYRAGIINAGIFEEAFWNAPHRPPLTGREIEELRTTKL